MTADGVVQSELYSIESAGASTAPVKAATEASLAGLSEAQLKATSFSVEHDEWRRWANVHRYARRGVSFREMNDHQRRLAHRLLQASLSVKGLKTTRDIMRLNEPLAELTRRPEEYGEFLDWMTAMGTPSRTEPWRWHLDGHHLEVNSLVLGDQVVMTPTFMGSEPVFAASGKYTGTRVLQRQRNRWIAGSLSSMP